MSTSCNSWRFQITRQGSEYGVKKQTLESRMQLFVSEADVTHISIGHGAEDYIHIRGLSIQHLVCILSEQKMTVMCRDAVRITSKKVDEQKNVGEQLVLDMQDQGNHSFQFVFPNGSMIEGKYRREQESLPKEMLAYLQTTHGPIDKIEEGHTALIYKTKDDKVLKILRPSYANNKDVVKRFLRAAENFKEIEAPFFIKIHDIQHVPEKSLCYVVMDYFAGETLENYTARKGILSVDEARDIVCAVSLGLSVLQDYGYSCRNLSPENLAIGRNGQVRLTGFFLLKSVESTLTLPGARMVISNYSAPEQVANPSGVDVMADVFSLGAIFYKLVVGEPHLSTMNSKEYEQRLAHTAAITPEEIHDIANHVPERTCKVISALLQHNKEERPQPRAVLEMLGVDKRRIPPVRPKPAALIAQEDADAQEETVRIRPQIAAPSAPIADVATKPARTPEAVSRPASNRNVGHRQAQPSGAPLLAFLFLLLLGAGLFWYFSMRQTASIGFGKFLPANTRLLLVCESLDGMFRKLNLPAYPRLYESARQMSMSATGGNLLDAAFYQDLGIAADAPLGVAVAGSSVQDLRIILFATMKDASRMTDVLQNPARLPLPPMVKDRIAGVNCMVDNKNAPGFIFCSQGRYGLVYTAVDRQNLVSYFQQDILGRGKKFYDVQDFQVSMRNLGTVHDGYLYLDMAGANNLFKEMAASFARGPRQQPALAQNFWQNDVLATAVSCVLDTTSIRIGSYLHVKKDSNLAALYQTGSTKALPFLQRIVGDPLLCSFMNSDVSQSWQVLKEGLDKTLQMSPQAPAQNTAALLQQMQQQLQTMTGVAVNIEKEIILNCLGQFLLAVYNLPQSLQQPGCDVLLVASLRDSSLTAGLLDTMYNKMLPQMPPDVCTRIEIGDVSAYCVDLSGPQMKLGLTPCLGIVDNCLVLTSTKELFTRVAKREAVKGSLVFADNSLATGSVKIGRLWQEAMRLVGSNEARRYLDLATPVMQSLQEFKWDSVFREQGLHVSYHLLGEQNPLGLVFAEIDKFQSEAEELMSKWKSIENRSELSVEEKLAKLEAAKNFQTRHAYAFLLPGVQSLQSRLRMSLYREANALYQKIMMPYNMNRLADAWQQIREFPEGFKRVQDMRGEPYHDKLQQLQEQIVQKAKESLEQETRELQEAEERLAVPYNMPSQAWSKDAGILQQFVNEVPQLQEHYQRNQAILQAIKQKIADNKSKISQTQNQLAEFKSNYRRQFLQNYRAAMQARNFDDANRLLQNDLAALNSADAELRNLVDSYILTLRREHEAIQELLTTTERECKRLTNRLTTLYNYKDEKFTGTVMRIGQGTIALKTIKGEDLVVKIGELSMQSFESLCKGKRSAMVELAMGVLYFYSGEEKRALPVLQKFARDQKVAIAWELYE